MALKLLLNAGLIAIPVGGSLGALFGIDAARSAAGQQPLFTGNPNAPTGGGSTGGGSGGSGSTHNNGLTNTMYCEQSFPIAPPSHGQQYLLNPNQWGVTANSVGGLCMNVTTYNNETYPTKYTAPEWSVTWQWQPESQTQPVHAFPNIMVENILPVKLDKMTAIPFDFSWSYGLGDTVAQSTDTSLLAADNVNTNVAIDMFFDPDPSTAQNTQKAKFEVMVWFAQIGPASLPIGSKSVSRSINGTTFTLWAGLNTKTNQRVNTWIADTTTTNFNGDIYPLITDLSKIPGDLYPKNTDYMGVFALGTEAYFSNTNVTFWASSFSMDIQKA